MTLISLQNRFIKNFEKEYVYKKANHVDNEKFAGKLKRSVSYKKLEKFINELKRVNKNK